MNLVSSMQKLTADRRCDKPYNLRDPTKLMKGEIKKKLDQQRKAAMMLSHKTVDDWPISRCQTRFNRLIKVLADQANPRLEPKNLHCSKVKLEQAKNWWQAKNWKQARKSKWAEISLCVVASWNQVRGRDSMMIWSSNFDAYLLT